MCVVFEPSERNFCKKKMFNAPSSKLGVTDNAPHSECTLIRYSFNAQTVDKQNLGRYHFIAHNPQKIADLINASANMGKPVAVVVIGRSKAGKTSLTYGSRGLIDIMANDCWSADESKLQAVAGLCGSGSQSKLFDLGKSYTMPNKEHWEEYAFKESWTNNLEAVPVTALPELMQAVKEKGTALNPESSRNFLTMRLISNHGDVTFFDLPGIESTDDLVVPENTGEIVCRAKAYQ